MSAFALASEALRAAARAALAAWPKIRRSSGAACGINAAVASPNFRCAADNRSNSAAKRASGSSDIAASCSIPPQLHAPPRSSSKLDLNTIRVAASRSNAGSVVVATTVRTQHGQHVDVVPGAQDLGERHRDDRE